MQYVHVLATFITTDHTTALVHRDRANCSICAQQVILSHPGPRTDPRAQKPKTSARSNDDRRSTNDERCTTIQRTNPRLICRAPPIAAPAATATATAPSEAFWTADDKHSNYTRPLQDPLLAAARGSGSREQHQQPDRSIRFQMGAGHVTTPPPPSIHLAVVPLF